ncbi:MAG: Eco57I restriction-modification methylase domain-containing protein, partial [Candidatus Heimdallarchaeota archaeon]
MKNLSNSPKINNLFDKVQKNLELKENGSFSGILSSIQSLENDFLEDYTNRKKEGVYYTKKVISNFIFSETLCLLLKKRFNIKPIKNFNEILRLDEDLKNKIKLLLLNLKICDPACGSGVFLLSAVDLLYETIKKLDFRGQSSIIGVQLMDNLFGYDISDAAIKLTILKLLKWYSLNFNSNLNQIFNILCSNIRIEDSITSKINTKFDIVVGNPPYGNILTKNQKSFLKDENLFYNDIYCAYLLKAINWCDGIVGFLVPKSFLLRQSYIEFRNKLLSKSNLLKIFDIGPNLFKKATNEVQIILYEKKINE